MHSLSSTKLLLATTYALAALTPISATPFTLLSRSKFGINCDGSSYCAGHSGALNDILADANGLAVGTSLSAGTQFACKGIGHTSSGICAYTDSDLTIGPSTNGQSNSLGDVIEDLINHGCDPCGSAPIVRTGNDLSQGAVTVNFKNTMY